MSFKRVNLSSSEYHGGAIIPTPENIPLLIPDIKKRFSYGGGKISELMLMSYFLIEQ